MKDAKGHGSDARGAFGVAAKFGPNAPQVGDYLKNMARMQLNDMAAQKELAAGSPKSDAVPVHSAMDRAVAQIQSEFSGRPGGPGSSFKADARSSGPVSGISAVRREGWTKGPAGHVLASGGQLVGRVTKEAAPVSFARRMTDFRSPAPSQYRSHVGGNEQVHNTLGAAKAYVERRAK